MSRVSASKLTRRSLCHQYRNAGLTRRDGRAKSGQTASNDKNICRFAFGRHAR
jgi:hypothetical protein